jgi:signal transduction histidine kinase
LVAIGGEVALPDSDLLITTVDVVAGAAFLAVGIVRWHVARRHAMLAYAAGVAWFVGGMLPALLWIHRPLMLHAALAYPTGRFRSRSGRGVVAAAWLIAVVPALAQDPYVSLTLTGFVAGVAWREVATAPVGSSRATRRTAGPTALLAAALGVPSAVRLFSPQLLDSRVPAVLYACLIACSGLAMLAGRPRPQREIDVVIELVQNDPARTLAKLRREAGIRGDAGTRSVVLAAIGLLETNLALHAELAEKVADVRVSRRRLIEAALHEHQRLERQLSDGALRCLNKLEVELDGLRGSPHDLVASLADRSYQEAVLTRDDLGQIARGLHPRALAERGLPGALSDLAARSPVPTTAVFPSQRFSELVESTVWYVCAEALANVVKHSAATSAHIDVHVEAAVLTISVSDNGVGGALVGSDGGLSGLADRLAALDGQIHVESPPNGGTLVTVQVPVS